MNFDQEIIKDASETSKAVLFKMIFYLCQNNFYLMMFKIIQKKII